MITMLIIKFNLTRLFFLKDKFIIIFKLNIKIQKNGDWGLGIGDWGLGIGDWGQSSIRDPQSLIPTPH